MSDEWVMHETQQHRNQELRVADVIARKWQCLPVKLPIRDILDFALVRQNILMAFCEVKTTDKTYSDLVRLNGYLINLDKWMTAQNMCNASGVPFVLIVETSDKKLVYAAYKDDFSVVCSYYSGRTDRTEDKDIKPCVKLDFNKFKLIE